MVRPSAFAVLPLITTPQNQGRVKALGYCTAFGAQATCNSGTRSKGCWLHRSAVRFLLGKTENRHEDNGCGIDEGSGRDPE